MKYHHLDEHLWFQSFADSRVSNAEIIAQLIAVNWGFRYFKLQILRTPRLWAAPMGVWRISIKELPQVSRGKNLIETATNRLPTTQNPEENITNIYKYDFLQSPFWTSRKILCSQRLLTEDLQRLSHSGRDSGRDFFGARFSLIFCQGYNLFTRESWETKLRVWPWFLSFIWLLVHWYTSMSWWFISCS